MLPMNTSTNHHSYHSRRGRARAAACFRRKKRNRRSTGRDHKNTNNKWTNAAPKNNVVQLFEFPWPGGVSFTEHICEQDMIAYEESLYNTVNAVLNDDTRIYIYTHNQLYNDEQCQNQTLHEYASD
tara:strand:+ start:1019 stop:1396 length:378 start_codon:yes stop_codon:yes gene_type:complete